MAEKLRSRTEGRWGKLALLHFERFWAQTAATRGPKIDKKSMKNRCKNQWEIWLGYCMALGAFFGRLWGCVWDPGPLILSVSCRRDANSQNFFFFMFGLTFL